MSTVEELQRRVEELERALEAAKAPGEGGRGKINQMSGEVVDSNPYSRLMALKRMGIVDNYECLPNPFQSSALQDLSLS